MSGVSGPGNDALKQLLVQFERVSDGTLQDEMKKRLGAKGLDLVQQGFRTATDPYDHPWKQSRRGGSTLRDTGRLLTSFSAQPTSNGFEVGTDTKYAATHQYGAVIKPKNAKALAVPIVTGHRIRALRGGKRLKNPVQQKGVLFLKQVQIPKRQMVPEGTLGDRWERGLGREANACMHANFEK